VQTNYHRHGSHKDDRDSASSPLQIKKVGLVSVTVLCDKNIKAGSTGEKSEFVILVTMKRTQRDDLNS
jgi:hypothetical protein